MANNLKFKAGYIVHIKAFDDEWLEKIISINDKQYSFTTIKNITGDREELTYETSFDSISYLNEYAIKTYPDNKISRILYL